MAKRDLNLLLSVLTHPELYGLTYMLIYFELDDRSDGRRELHHVLFDDTGVEDPGLIACAFQTINQVGVFVVAENVELLGKSGPIPLEALPRDMNCEISFPAGPLEDRPPTIFTTC